VTGGGTDDAADDHAGPLRHRAATSSRAIGVTGTAIIALVASAVALVASTVALAFSLWPSLAPDPQSTLSASLKVETLEPGVTLDRFLAQVGEDPHRLKPSVRKARGLVAYVRIRIEGRKHGTLQLHQIRYDARTGRRLPDQDRTEDSSVGADTPNDQWIHRVFILEPPYDYPVFVRLELYDGDVMLTYVDTPSLPRRRGQSEHVAG